MRKAVVASAVLCALYGATLLAIGIYIAQYNLAELFVQMLAEKLNILALIFAILLYVPIILMQIIPYVFIIYGIGYVLCPVRILYRLHKDDLPWLHKNLNILSVAHCCLFILIAIADAVIIAYIVKNTQNGVSVALVVFTVLINATAAAFEASVIVAVKKLKKYLYE